MYYAGIDAHARYVVIAVIDKTGTVVCEATVATDARETLLATLAPYRPLDVVVESSSFWPWLQDLLVPAGITFFLAHAKALRAIATTAQKTDTVDARLLARMLATQLVPLAYPKPPAQRDTLRLIRHRAALVRQRTMLVNRIHAQLHQQGVSVPRERLLRRATQAWLRTDFWPQLAPAQQELVDSNLTLIAELTRHVCRVDRRLGQIASADPTVQLLRTIPGIGRFWGVLLANELTPIRRFPRPAHLVSYAGLAPVTRASGGRTRHGGVPAGANRWVRWALVSAVVKHVQKAPTSPLTHYYQRLTARLGWPTARVAAARKLARIIHHLLETGERWPAES